jgi:calcium/calmodulin-dependent protein kinase I
VKKSFYNEKEARDVVRTVCLGMKYCHDRGIAHRDLKPENLLLTTANDDAIVKIADFGFAIKGAAKSSLQTQCGTPGYVAPEILNNKPYGKAVDMWSIGVITYILLGGYPPFHDENQKNLFKKIKKGEFEFHEEYWGAVSSDAKDLIRGLLHVDPESRLTVDDVLGHSWVNQDGAALAGRDLMNNLAELRKYQATRKFKAAANAVIAINRMNNMFKTDETKKAEPVEAAPAAAQES